MFGLHRAVEDHAKQQQQQKQMTAIYPKFIKWNPERYLHMKVMEIIIECDFGMQFH